MNPFSLYEFKKAFAQTSQAKTSSEQKQSVYVRKLSGKHRSENTCFVVALPSKFFRPSSPARPLNASGNPDSNSFMQIEIVLCT